MGGTTAAIECCPGTGQGCHCCCPLLSDEVHWLFAQIYPSIALSTCGHIGAHNKLQARTVLNRADLRILPSCLLATWMLLRFSLTESVQPAAGCAALCANQAVSHVAAALCYAWWTAVYERWMVCYPPDGWMVCSPHPLARPSRCRWASEARTLVLTASGLSLVAEALESHLHMLKCTSQLLLQQLGGSIVGHHMDCF